MKIRTVGGVGESVWFKDETLRGAESSSVAIDRSEDSITGSFSRGPISDSLWKHRGSDNMRFKWKGFLQYLFKA
jgi:hypothetical protein